MSGAAELAAHLAARRPWAGPVALVVAHPDDETIALGGSLALLPDLLLVHVTDGAPRLLDDAARHGFADPARYAAAREAELARALATAGLAPARARLDIPDQEAALHLRAIADRLTALLRAHGSGLVLTHAYEGGHPDHDATACAAHHAARALGLPVLEFPLYRAGTRGMVVQRFLPGPRPTLIRLAAGEARAKRAMLACFATQEAVTDWFDPARERLRPAAPARFDRPPHPGRLNYEAWGWEMDGDRFRALARAAFTEGRCAA